MTTQNTPTFSRVLLDAIESHMIQVHTCIPAQVVSYNPANQTITAQPVIQYGYLDETDARQAETLPPIQNVPVMFYGTGAYSDAFPLTKGDFVWIMFSEASLDRWKSTGMRGQTAVDPGNDRHHHISDAVAYPGSPRPAPNALPSSAIDPSARVLSAPALKLGDSSASKNVAWNQDLADLVTLIGGGMVSGVQWVPTGTGDGASLISAIAALKSARAGQYPTGSSKVTAV